MTAEQMRTIASDIVVISIALLGVTFILIALAWKGFEPRFAVLTRDQRRAILRILLVTNIPTLAPMAIVTVVGVYAPDMVQVSYFLVFLVLTAMALVYLLAVGVQRLLRHLSSRKANQPPAIKPNSTTLLYTYSLLLLTIAIFCVVFSLTGTITTALQLNSGPYQMQTFDLARWLLVDAVSLLVIGMFCLAVSFVDGVTSEWKQRKESVSQ